MVIFRNDVNIFVCRLLHLLAGGEREARVSREKKSLLQVMVRVVFVGIGAVKHLGGDASEGPDVDGGVVVFLNHDDFWWSVPS